MPTRHQRYQKALNDLNEAFDWFRWNPTDPLAVSNLKVAQQEYTEAWREFSELEKELDALKGSSDV